MCIASRLSYGPVMNLNLQSGTSAYEQMRTDNVVIMPSSGTLAKNKQAQKIVVGNCVVMYEKQLLIRGFLEEIGELMCDEMKMKQDVLLHII